jgi:hypothetical protein
MNFHPGDMFAEVLQRLLDCDTHMCSQRLGAFDMIVGVELNENSAAFYDSIL